MVQCSTQNPKERRQEAGTESSVRPTLNEALGDTLRRRSLPGLNLSESTRSLKSRWEMGAVMGWRGQRVVRRVLGRGALQGLRSLCCDGIFGALFRSAEKGFDLPALWTLHKYRLTSRPVKWRCVSKCPSLCCCWGLKVCSVRTREKHTSLYRSGSQTSWSLFNTAHFACLICLTDSFQVLEHIGMSWWPDSSVFDSGDMQNGHCWEGSRNITGNHSFTAWNIVKANKQHKQHKQHKPYFLQYP